MKFASDEKVQIQKALWEVVKTASMALMRLSEFNEKSEAEEQLQSKAGQNDMSIYRASQNPMVDRVASLKDKPKNFGEKKVAIQESIKPPVKAIKKASLTDDKIKSFAVRIGNEVLPMVKNDDYDLRFLFKQSNTWNNVKDSIDTNSMKSIISSVNDLIQNKLDQRFALEMKKQDLLKQSEDLKKQSEDLKKKATVHPKDDLVESRKQMLVNSVKAQKNILINSIIKEMKPFVKMGNMASINEALQKSSTWQVIKVTLSNQAEKNAFVSEMIQASGFLNSKSADFQRDVVPPNRDSFSTGSQTNKQTEKAKPSTSGTPKGEIENIGLSAPDAPLNRARNLDHGEAYGKKPSTALNNIHEVVDSGGSAKVIPDNKGFANNSSPLRTSAEEALENEDLGDEDLENLWSTDPSEEYGMSSDEELGSEDDGINPDMDDDDFFGEGN